MALDLTGFGESLVFPGVIFSRDLSRQLQQAVSEDEAVMNSYLWDTR